MGKLFLLVFMMLSTLSLRSASLSVSSGHGSIRGDDFAFDFSRGSAYLSLGLLSYGDISSSGMVRVFADPYGFGHDFFPDVSSTGDERSGFVLSLGAFSFVFSTDSRPLTGISFRSEHIEASVMHAYGTEEERGFHESPEALTLFGTSYASLKLEYGPFRMRLLSSYAAEVGSRSFISGHISHDAYSLTVSLGSLIALYEENESVFGIRGSFGEDGFVFIFSHSVGHAPVFSEDYLSTESYASAVLKLGNIVLHSAAESSFTESGRRKHRERFSLETEYLRLGYDTDDGPFVIVDGNHISFGYEEGYPFVKLMWELSGECFSALLEISSEGELDVSLRVVI